VKKPPCVWVPSTHYSTRMGAAIDTIVLHNTAAPARQALAWLRNPSAKVSAHYLVDREGHVAQLVRDDMCAWHAGVASVNQRSIGIEIEAYAGAEGMTPLQAMAVRSLVTALAEMYDVAAENIISHRSVRPTECPGFVWPSDAELAAWIQAQIKTQEKR
jgi:N-acetylmuramoyl-L-alanine amidase